MKRTLTFAAALALGAATLLPLAASAQVSLGLFINAAPPAPRYESIPAAREGYVWAPGFWNYEGNRHVWIGGHWEAARQGYQFQRAEWQRDNDGWRLNRGGWQQVSSDRAYAEVRIAPPEPRYERVPHARPGYLWVPGYWTWTGYRHEWKSGGWLRERPGYVYTQPRWNQRDGQWFLEQGRWEQGRDREYGHDRGYGHDRDHDGIPDRYEGGRDRDHDGVPDRFERHDHDRDRDGIPDAHDRDRDNDGVPNRWDADRDGDGVPNDRDRRPDDPNRR